MKKQLLIICIFVMMAYQSMAVPAHRAPVTITQPDGTSVTIQLRGDEWMHYETTTDGYSVIKNKKGYYVYAELKEGRLMPTGTIAHDVKDRKAAEREFLRSKKKYQAPAMTPQTAEKKKAVLQQRQQTLAKRKAIKRSDTNAKEIHGIVILIQYKDKEFSTANTQTFYNDMLNKKGYDGYVDGNGKKQEYTGSLHEYFNDNTSGAIKTHFDIAGPYTVDFSQYDPKMGYSGDEARDSKTRDILYAAIDSADVDVDFSQYDNNGDGIVDFLYFIVAGTGSNYSSNDKGLWWPHQSHLYYEYDEEKSIWRGPTKDGVELLKYASSVELCGWESQPESIKPDGIGTICHEFSHVLGLPDFYDADYEKSGGMSNTLGEWSLMDAGCYCNNARTPVGYSIYERRAIGADADITKIDSAGSYVLQPSPVGLKGLYIDDTNEEEFFILENRNKEASKWDAYLPGNGLLVYHVDITNEEVWLYNEVNNDPSHNYYKLLLAGGEHTDKDGNYIKTAADAFPGTDEVTELTNESMPANLLNWNGEPSKRILKNIAMNGQDITFDVFKATSTGISGIQKENKTSEEKRYNLQGQRVSKDYKGIVITGGHKRM